MCRPGWVVTQFEIAGSPSAASISATTPSIDQTALATVSAGRFWPCGPSGITPLNDCLTRSIYGRGTAGANTHWRGHTMTRLHYLYVLAGAIVFLILHIHFVVAWERLYAHHPWRGQHPGRPLRLYWFPE